MARRKAARRHTDSLKGRITRACVSCGRAVTAGVLVCSACVIAATPAQARPHPAKPQPVAVRPLPHDHPLAIPERLMGLLGDRPEDRDLPEPDVTLYEPGVFAAGTAVTARAGVAQVRSVATDASPGQQHGGPAPSG